MLLGFYADAVDLTLHQLRLFLAVVDHTTVSAAADALGYTPSAVSQQLSGLEQACGIAVFDRVGRGLQLTDAGRVLVPHARGLLQAAEAALSDVACVNEVVAGTVTMSAYESVASTLLPPLLRAGREEHPELELRVRQMDPAESIPALLRGDVDLAFTVDYAHAPVGATPGVDTWNIVHDPFRLVVADNDPLGNGPVDLSSLADRPFISSPPEMSCGACVVAACRRAGFDPIINHALDDYPTSLQLVAAGEGIALVPDLGLTRPPPGVRILTLREPVTRDVQLAVRTASRERPIYVAVRDALVRIADDIAARTAAHAA